MSILHFTLDKYMYNTKITGWRTVPGRIHKLYGAGPLWKDWELPVLLPSYNLTRDLWLVVQRYSRARLIASGVTSILKVSWERNNQHTLAMASIIWSHELVWLAVLFTVISKKFDLSSDADFQDIERCHLCADRRSVSSSSAKPSICRAVDSYKERSKIRQ